MGSKGREAGITARSLIIGLILIPVNCYWIVMAETVWYSGWMTCVSLFFNTIFFLFLLVMVNLLLIRYLPKYALTQGELIVIYIMQVVASSLAGRDMMQNLARILVDGIWFATPENEWKELFWSHLPRWLIVQDAKTLDHFFGGESSPYISSHLRHWATPITAWFVFILAVTFVMLCINTIVRKQWTEQEKLSYPIIRLPLEMTGEPSRFFRNRMMWIGFGIAAGIDILNGLHFLYPAIPGINVKLHDISRFFQNRPWSAMGRTRISFYPFTIGLAFFLPLDLSVSCWFFYLFRKAERIIGDVAGWQSLPRFPYFNEQASGAWLGLCVLALWITKGHLKLVGKRVLGLAATSIDDSNEPMTYRTAVLGMVGAGIFLLLFCQWAGMSIWTITLYFAIYYALGLAITRVRAELGPPTQEIFFVNPQQIMIGLTGTRRLGTANLTVMSVLYWLNRCNRSHPMPNQLEAFKLAERTHISNRRVASVIIFATAVGTLATFWALLAIFYKYGGIARAYRGAAGREIFTRLEGWLQYPTGVDVPGITFMGIGFAFTILLMIMRLRFIWWPFHPAGYALATSFAVDYYWFPVLISGVIKWVIIKHGGIKSYRQFAPLFLGLILGEYVVGCIWSIIEIFASTPMYKVWVF